jgi:hypothetical protein
MKAWRVIFALAVVLTLLTAGGALADENPPGASPPPSETLAAQELLKLTPPPHYCALDPKLDADYLALARIGHAASGHDLLVLWRDCKTLAASRTGLEDYSTPEIAITAKFERGHILHLDMTRAAFLAEMGRWLASHGSETERETELSGTRLLGVMARDERALYIGLLTDKRVNGKDTVLAFVLGVTLLKGLFIQVSVVEEFDGNLALSNEISYAQQIMHRLVADNPDNPTTSN